MEVWIEPVIALVALTAMEIVLGIDNIVFIAILVGRLPKHQQAKARTLGLGLAMVMRVLLLLAISWVLGLTEVAFTLSNLGIPETWGWVTQQVNEVQWRDLVVLVGGLFLVGKSVVEIHHQMEDHHQRQSARANVSFSSVLVQIALLDIVFSLDSVITAVGMADDLWVMIVAVILAIGVMLVFAGKVSEFVDRHPTLKVLALSFLILIGVMLIAEGIGTHINKGYVYFAMAFALGVEALNLRLGSRRKSADEHTAVPWE